MTEPVPSPGSTSLPAWVVPVAIGCGVLILAGVVLIVIAIVASIAIPQFVVARDRAFDQAAQAELARVMVAQETHRLETGVYTLYLEDLTFEDDPAVSTRILFANDADYEMCSRHVESESSWWVREAGGRVARSWTAC